MKKYEFITMQEAACLMYKKENLAAIAELHLNSADDKELFEFTKPFLGLGVSYPEGFDYERSLKIIELLGIDWLALQGKSLFDSSKEIYKAQGFIIKLTEKEIVGNFAVQEIEPKLSARILIDLKGDEKQKAQIAVAMTKFWNESYAKTLYEHGYKYITATALTDKNASLMRHIAKHEKKTGSDAGFYICGTGDIRRYKGEVLKETWYIFDLAKKYES